MKIREHENLVVRQYPDAVNNFLRFQIGRFTERQQVHPIFRGLKTLIGHRVVKETVPIYELMAYGVTEKQALARFDASFPPRKTVTATATAAA